MNSVAKTYCNGNSERSRLGFLFTNSTGRDGEAMATLDGLPAMPAGTPRCRAGGYPLAPILPRGAQLAGLEPRFAPPTFFLTDRSAT
jgi:hypothetical protein